MTTCIRSRRQQRRRRSLSSTSSSFALSTARITANGTLRINFATADRDAGGDGGYQRRGPTGGEMECVSRKVARWEEDREERIDVLVVLR